MSEYSRKGILEMPTSEQETLHDFEMQTIAPQGLGYGEGMISAADRASSPEHPVSWEQLAQAVEVLIGRKADITVPVEEADDGCGDGRPTDLILQKDPETGEIISYNKSRKRAKIFGGGLQVAASMWRAIAGEALSGETCLGDRTFIAGELKRRGMQYGAHTDNHAHGDNCGCGAIDKYTLSTKMSGKYREQITGTLGALIDNPAENAGVQQAFRTREHISDDAEYMSNATGRATMDFILDDGAVVKELGNEHLEAIAIFNDEPGTTIDQEKVAELLRAAGLPDTIQVFVVDLWRGYEYAETIADVAAEHGYDREAARETARADFLINQLSVAATLTKGDLPVIYNGKAG